MKLIQRILSFQTNKTSLNSHFCLFFQGSRTYWGWSYIQHQLRRHPERSVHCLKNPWFPSWTLFYRFGPFLIGCFLTSLQSWQRSISPQVFTGPITDLNPHPPHPLFDTPLSLKCVSNAWKVVYWIFWVSEESRHRCFSLYFLHACALNRRRVLHYCSYSMLNRALPFCLSSQCQLIHQHHLILLYILENEILASMDWMSQHHLSISHAGMYLISVLGK